jgi:hypothetical protein
MDAIIRYTGKIPMWRTIVGILIILLAIYGFIFDSAIRALLTLIIPFLILQTEGSEIDLEAKTFRKTRSILGYSIGKWQPLPNVEYVSVFSTSEDITIRDLSAETTYSRDIILLNIFHDRNQKFTAYSTSNIKDAFDVASHIADALAIDLLDATVKNDYKWVDKDALRDTGEIIYTD